MKFDMMTIQDLRREILRGNSPSDELLTLWGQQNHTVLELFVLLSEMQHYQAMLVLKPFGKCVCHFLIEELNVRCPLTFSDLLFHRVTRKLEKSTEEFDSFVICNESLYI
jgi:hypothetical protein